jgi:large subunit ribosomal protein L3
MIGIIGKKLGMTQIFNEQGQQIPCTVVEAPPNPVVQVLSAETAGVQSVQLGYGEQKLARDSKKGEGTPKGRRANKAVVGHAAKAQVGRSPFI